MAQAQQGLNLYKGRIGPEELAGVRDDMEEVPVKVNYGQEFSFVVFPSSYSDQVNGELSDMRLVRENADPGYVMSWTNLHERDVEELLEDFSISEALEQATD